MQNEIISIFRERDEILKIYNDKMIRLCEDKINKALLHSFNIEYINWEVFSSIPASSDNYRAIISYGKIQPRIGEVLQNPYTGSKIVITPENINDTVKVIRVIIPLKLFNDSFTHQYMGEVIKSLQELELMMDELHFMDLIADNRIDIASLTELEEIIRTQDKNNNFTVQETQEESKPLSSGDIRDTLETLSSFDSDALTEQQKRALLSLTFSTKNNKTRH